MNLKNFYCFSLIIAMMCGVTVEVNAQEKQTPTQENYRTRIVKGTVKDVNGDPLTGVSIRLKEVLIGTTTDLDGNYTLQVPLRLTNPILVYSFVGMTTVEKKIGVRSIDDVVINVVMHEGEALKEVIVTGIFTKAKESFTGAASMLLKKDLEMAGNRSLLTSIQNLDPSFNIAENIMIGSDPNSLPNITMRGASSLPTDVRDMQINQDTYRASNQPLIILNGFEISLERFKDLDENLVESITLLKDANSTALYGTKGSNGVVVITTREPIAGKMTITYRGSLNIEAPDLGSYSLMNAREKLAFEQAAGLYSGGRTPADQIKLDNLYNQRKLQEERGVDTYWIKFPVRTGFGQRHSVTFEGGDRSMMFTGGLSYNGIEATMKGSNRRTLSGDISLMYKNGNVTIRNDLQIMSMNAKNSPYGNFSQYTKINSYYSPYEGDGTIAQILEEEITYQNLSSMSESTSQEIIYNPLYDAKLPGFDKNEYVEIMNNFGLDWNILPTLTFRGQVGITSTKRRSDIYVPIGHSMFADYSESDNDRKGKYTYGTGNMFRYEVKGLLNYTKTFNGKHEVSMGGGVTIEEVKSEDYRIVGEGISTPTMDFLGMTNRYEKDGKPYGSESIRRNAGVLMNANYVYDRKYLFNANGKYEGSSQFGANNRYAPVWSVGTGWNIHQEDFMQNQKIVDVARIRLSYGITGSQSFASYLGITTYQDYSVGGYLDWYGMNIIQFGNPDLEWQKTKQVNLGFDLEVLDRRVKIAVDVYNRLTDNLISDISLPLSSGFSKYSANIGEVENKGVELDLSAYILRDTKRKGFTWNVGVKMIHNKNTIKKISNSLDNMNTEIGSEASRNPSFLYKEGESMNTIFAVKSRGIDPSNGKEIFVKLDGTETYDWDAKDKIAAGIAEPKVLGNFNTTLRYNGFSVTAYFSFRFGGQYYNGTLANKVENIQPFENADKRAYYDRWKKPGDESKFKSLTIGTATYASTRFVMDDNSLSCANLTLGYDVPPSWSMKYLYSQKVSVKVQLEDLFHVSSIKQERGTSYPYAKKYSLVLAATF